jgi:hypothetical protein
MDCDCGEKDLETERVECCSCHINPPCGACVDAPYVCRKCGEQYEVERPNYSNVKSIPYVPPKRKTLSDLSRDKIDWIYTDHGGRSFVEVHGYCPQGTTKDDILVHLRIKHRPCLPMFKAFDSNGYFKLSYFTD